MSAEPTEKWKIDVNDRYQKVIGEIIALATASLVLPIFLLKNFFGISDTAPLTKHLTASAYWGWAFFVASIVLGALFYYFSAKWVKLAWGHRVKFISHHLETLLDWTFWLSIGSFVAGLVCFLYFAATVPSVSANPTVERNAPKAARPSP